MKGVVVVEKGIPIAGANVSRLKSKNFVQTDFGGNFTIIAAVNEKLLIQYLGMEQVCYDVKKTDKLTPNVTNIVLTESAFLGEVVISVKQKPSFFRKITRPFRNLFKKKKCTTSLPK